MATLHSFPPAKILIIGPAWIGDMVMAQVLFKELKQRYPRVQLDVVAPTWTTPLLGRMPEITQAFSLPIGHGELNLGKRYALAKTLRTLEYDQAIVLPNSWKSALIPFWARIRKRTGWRGEMRWGLLNDIRYLDKEKLPLMAQRFLALGLSKDEAVPANYPYPQLVVDSKQVEHLCHRFGLVDKQRPILALAPGAEFGPAKRWPVEHYAALANHWLNHGWQVWLFGSPKEQSLTEAIQQLTQRRCTDLAGKIELGEAIDLLSLATVVVSNDSGLMHIAAALQRPQIAMYGSTSPHFTPPLNDKASTVSLQLACSPCFRRKCPLSGEQHLRCLTHLLPDQIIPLIQAHDGHYETRLNC